MSRLTDQVLDIFFPTRCILCRELISPPGRPRICPDCQRSMPQAAGARRRGDFFSVCVSALYYEGAVPEAVRRFKFRGAQAYAPAFGELVAERVYEDLDDGYDLVTWVPLSRDRLRRRGYDQTELIAKSAAARLRRPLTRLVVKRKGVPPQSRTQDESLRRANITGAFTVPEPGPVRGKRVLLIDDIVTTGATLSECAKTLLLSGADEVLCATLAAARKRSHPPAARMEESDHAVI